jgi:hypothetical protein
MHFRERSHMVQLIRTAYDPELKRGKSEIIGRLAKANPKVTEDLRALLTPDEQKQLAAWMAGHATVERLKRELAVRTLPEQLALAEEWFATQKGEEARVVAANLVAAWSRLRGTLKREGFLE